MTKWRKNGEVDGELEIKALQRYTTSIITTKIGCRIKVEWFINF